MADGISHDSCRANSACGQWVDFSKQMRGPAVNNGKWGLVQHFHHDSVNAARGSGLKPHQAVACRPGDKIGSGVTSRSPSEEVLTAVRVL